MKSKLKEVAVIISQAHGEKEPCRVCLDIASKILSDPDIQKALELLELYEKGELNDKGNS